MLMVGRVAKCSDYERKTCLLSLVKAFCFTFAGVSETGHFVLVLSFIAVYLIYIQTS